MEFNWWSTHLKLLPLNQLKKNFEKIIQNNNNNQNDDDDDDDDDNNNNNNDNDFI